MLDMQTDATALTATFGCHVVETEADDLMRQFRQVTDADVSAKQRQILDLFETPDPKSDPITRKLTSEDLEMAARAGAARIRIVEAPMTLSRGCDWYWSSAMTNATVLAAQLNAAHGGTEIEFVDGNADDFLWVDVGAASELRDYEYAALDHDGHTGFEKDMFFDVTTNENGCINEQKMSQLQERISTEVAAKEKQLDEWIERLMEGKIDLQTYEFLSAQLNDRMLTENHSSDTRTAKEIVQEVEAAVADKLNVAV